MVIEIHVHYIKKKSSIAHEKTISITGWWLTYPSEKYESQLEGLSHILWKIKMFQTTNQIIEIHVHYISLYQIISSIAHEKTISIICSCPIKSVFLGWSSPPPPPLTGPRSRCATVPATPLSMRAPQPRCPRGVLGCMGCSPMTKQCMMSG